MQHYTLYTMDHAGHIAFAHDLHCEDDEQACEQGRHEAGTHGVEVWQGSRLVTRVPPTRQ